MVIAQKKKSFKQVCEFLHFAFKKRIYRKKFICREWRPELTSVPFLTIFFLTDPLKSLKTLKFQDEKKIQDCNFYFSLENSNCSGYITEKFSNGLLSYAVPIVNGWLESYEKELPGSFIHLSKFRSMAELGNYLDYLLKTTPLILNITNGERKIQLLITTKKTRNENAPCVGKWQRS